jgi:hypothetical protein
VERLVLLGALALLELQVKVQLLITLVLKEGRLELT